MKRLYQPPDWIYLNQSNFNWMRRFRLIAQFNNWWIRSPISSNKIPISESFPWLMLSRLTGFINQVRDVSELDRPKLESKEINGSVFTIRWSIAHDVAEVIYNKVLVWHFPMNACNCCDRPLMCKRNETERGIRFRFGLSPSFPSTPAAATAACGWMWKQIKWSTLPLLIEK